MSKGSRQRPTDKERFDAEFDRIFGSRQYTAWDNPTAGFVWHTCTDASRREIRKGSTCTQCNVECN